MYFKEMECIAIRKQELLDQEEKNNIACGDANQHAQIKQEKW